MQRRARNVVTSTALAITLTGGLAACSGSSDPGGDGESTPGGSTATAPEAPPGKYRTLPEPCGAVSKATLKSLLPGTQADTDEEDASPYAGKADLTYDAERRVGCSWKSATTLGSRHLSIGLERVVSYDPSISDDEQAELLFDESAAKADIPSSAESSPDEKESPGKSGSGKASEPGSGATGKEQSGNGAGDGTETKGDGTQQSGSEGAKQESASPSPSLSPGKNLSPRPLTGFGQSAYIDDELITGDSGVHRDITLVFRSANVIATIEYNQWLTDKQRMPDSRELQEQAERVATELAQRFDEN